MKYTPLIILIAGQMLVVNAKAALVERLGGLAYYDTELDITWLADANYAQTSGYDDDGAMDWATANAWASSLSINEISGWRLADTTPINEMNFDYTYSYDGSSDGGYNISATGTLYEDSQGSEMGYLFYNTLGNTGYYDTEGAETGCTAPNYCLTSTGPFTNIYTGFYGGYWSSTEYVITTTDAWYFSFYDGYQANHDMDNNLYAWAVHDGDVGTTVVPVPAAAWLFGSGLIALVVLARRNLII